MYGMIYCITNKDNGKQYVGQTIQKLKDRWRDHCSTWHSGTFIGRAIHKHGREAFSLEVLEECSSKEELDLRERDWIKRLDTTVPNGYNIAPGGHHDPMPPEHYERIAKKIRGRKRSVEFCENLRKKLKGRRFTAEWRLKLSIKAQQRQKSPEHIKAFNEAGIRAAAAPEIRKKRMGEGNSNCRLTKSQVHEIRARYAGGAVSQQQLADEYGVGQTQISRIIRRVHWI